MDHCDILLLSVVVALDGVVVHSHDQEAPLLAQLKNVRIVDWVGQEGPICQTVDEKLVV